MKKYLFLGFILFFAATNGCKDKDEDEDKTDLLFEFSSGENGWVGGFADYPFGEEVFHELDWRISNLPEPLDISKKALKIVGANHSDDLFMFIKKRITGLLPEKNYKILFNVDFASDAPEGGVGIGGDPASVFLKAGAVIDEPKSVLDTGDDFYRMNIDKGFQAIDGKDMMNLGNISNGKSQSVYTLVKRRNSDELFQAKTDNQGALWLIVGTDSGFEGTTTLYYTKIQVTLSPL